MNTSYEVYYGKYPEKNPSYLAWLEISNSDWDKSICSLKLIDNKCELVIAEYNLITKKVNEVTISGTLVNCYMQSFKPDFRWTEIKITNEIITIEQGDYDLGSYIKLELSNLINCSGKTSYKLTNEN